jgi:nucleoporin NUP82
MMRQSLPPEEANSPQRAMTDKRSRAYVSLLEFEPYLVPPILSRFLGLPSHPRLALPVSERNSEFSLTPDTLRFMGQMIEQIRAQISEVRLAHDAASSRSALQIQEFQRQTQKGRQIVEYLEQMKGLKQVRTLERVTKIRVTQTALLSRLDRVLQGLMRKASLELSENETKWFAELKRMKDQILGVGRYDESSLRGRTKHASHFYFWIYLRVF